MLFSAFCDRMTVNSGVEGPLHNILVQKTKYIVESEFKLVDKLFRKECKYFWSFICAERL